ncbi:MAG: tyrosine-type recombinase/integrase [Desulfovibrionaceae bacterium]|nr:tyrosine-type recombinase/integrase [Desulfovibrionaceae bacterium]
MGRCHLERRVLRVHGSHKNESAPWREIPIRQSLIPLFEQWQAEDLAVGAQHLVNYNGKPVKIIRGSWESALERAGITRRIRPYDLRHMFGTELVAAGADIGTVAKLMGHSSPTMLLNHYQYVMDKQKVRAIESLPDVPQ